MRWTAKAIAIFFSAAVFLSSASVAAAATAQGPQATAGKGTPSVPSIPLQATVADNRIVVSNSHIVVWFQGFKPMLHVFIRNQSGNNTGFSLAVDAIYEINSTGAPVAALPLLRAYPEIGDIAGDRVPGPVPAYTSGFSLVYNRSMDAVIVTFSLTANEVSAHAEQAYNASPSDAVYGFGPMVGTASAEVVFIVNASTAHVRFNIYVNKWTWVNQNGDRLAMDVSISGHQTVRDREGQYPSMKGIKIGEGKKGSDGEKDSAVSSAYMRDRRESLSIVGMNSVALGYISWASIANATYSNGTVAPLNVTVTMFSRGFNGEADVHLLFTFTPPAGWASNYSSLAYDPTVGISLPSPSPLSYLTSPLGLIAVGLLSVGAAGIALALRRRH